MPYEALEGLIRPLCALSDSPRLCKVRRGLIGRLSEMGLMTAAFIIDRIGVPHPNVAMSGVVKALKRFIRPLRAL